MNLANAITLTSLVAALVGVALAIHGELGYAMIAMIASGLCDIFHGMIA